MNEEVRKQNFISVDKQTAINSHNEVFCVGETVEHEDRDAGQAMIISFEPDEEYNEVKAWTSRGYAHLDFLVKL